MSKAVLISIRPKWCELIASGEKTIEVRKTVPKIETPFKCYVYQTLSKSGYLNKGDGHVVGEFVCGEIQRYARYGQFKEPARYMKSSPRGYPATEIHYSSLQLSPDALEQYGKGAQLYGWHISELKVYEKPKELCEFYRWYDGTTDIRPCENGKPCDHLVFDYSEDHEACGIDYDGDNCPFLRVTRPPQSWCYVEELT